MATSSTLPSSPSYATVREAGAEAARPPSRRLLAVALAALPAAMAIFLSGIVAAQANTLPVANAGENQQVVDGTLITLQGSATDPDGDPIVDWLWTLEAAPMLNRAEINSPDAPNATFWPGHAGHYVISLIAFDGKDWSLPDLLVINLVWDEETLQMLPVAVAAGIPTRGKAPLTVEFDGSGSYHPEGADLTYEWGFGDDTPPSYEVNAQHKFKSPGTYWVALAVYDESGLVDLDAITISVSDANIALTANPTATPNSGSAPLTVAFAANASEGDGDPLSYFWDFGDPSSPDNSSTLENPSHVYEQAGIYVAWLTVAAGADSVSESVTVFVDPMLKTAKIAFTKKDPNLAHFMVNADSFTVALPAPDDLIAVVVDGAVLFERPFSDFVKTKSRTKVIYKLRDRMAKITAKMDFTKQTFLAKAKNVLATSVDNSNGVTCEVLIGTGGAVETVVMTPNNTGNRLKYRRPRSQ